MNACESVMDLRLSLVTVGDPDRQTGGYRYHRMMERAAHAHGADMRSFSIPALAWPLGIVPAARTVRAASDRSDGILLDSIAAALAAPWIRRERMPVVAVVHQRPGGVDHGPIRSSTQGAVDRLAYRHASGVVAAAESLVEDLCRSGVPAERIRVVPPGCDVPVAAGPPRDLRRGRRAAVLCVANWLPTKASWSCSMRSPLCPMTRRRSGSWAPMRQIGRTPHACIGGSPRPISRGAWWSAGRCQSRRSDGSIDRPTSSRCARWSMRTGRPGQKRSPLAFP